GMSKKGLREVASEDASGPRSWRSTQVYGELGKAKESAKRETQKSLQRTERSLRAAAFLWCFLTLAGIKWASSSSPEAPAVPLECSESSVMSTNVSTRSSVSSSSRTSTSRSSTLQ